MSWSSPTRAEGPTRINGLDRTDPIATLSTKIELGPTSHAAWWARPPRMLQTLVNTSSNLRKWEKFKVITYVGVVSDTDTLTYVRHRHRTQHHICQTQTPGTTSHLSQTTQYRFNQNYISAKEKSTVKARTKENLIWVSWQWRLSWFRDTFVEILSPERPSIGKGHNGQLWKWCVQSETLMKLHMVIEWRVWFIWNDEKWLGYLLSQQNHIFLNKKELINILSGYS